MQRSLWLAALALATLLIACSGDDSSSTIQQGASAAPEECDLGLGPREVVLSAADGRRLGLSQFPDSILGVLKQGNSYTFFGSRGGSATTSAVSAKLVGTLDNPGATSVRPSMTIQGLKYPYDYAGGGPVYRDPATGNLLMFYHAEKHPGGDNFQFYALYAMAKSTDGGDTWHDLGEIVTPEVPYSDTVPPGTAPRARGVPLPAAPYVIAGDYFYVYAKDRPSYDLPVTFFTVARARVTDVVAGANERNTVVAWSKYYNGTWNEPGLGGKASSLEAGNPPIRQLDVSYNDYLGRYLAAVIVGSPNGNILYLMESADGLTWGPRRLADEEPALNIYPTLIGLGDDPKVTGKQFYVYFPIGEPGGTDNYLVRRLISCEPGLRTHTNLTVGVDGTRTVAGKLESDGKPIAGARLELSLRPIEGPGVFTTYTLTGTVPAGATQALANLNFLRQTDGTGAVDLRVYDIRYSESGDPAQRVQNGDFSQGLQAWGGSGGVARIETSDRSSGNMLHITAAPNETGSRTSLRFRVIPGATFTATFAARVSPSSVDAGFFGINFQDASGAQVSREIVVFKPIEVKDAVETDAQGAFRFGFDDLGTPRVLVEARYDGNSSHWSAFVRQSLTLR